jgi:hypothetical protein
MRDQCNGFKELEYLLQLLVFEILLQLPLQAVTSSLILPSIPRGPEAQEVKSC